MKSFSSRAAAATGAFLAFCACRCASPLSSAEVSAKWEKCASHCLANCVTVWLGFAPLHGNQGQGLRGSRCDGWHRATGDKMDLHTGAARIRAGAACAPPLYKLSTGFGTRVSTAPLTASRSAASSTTPATESIIRRHARSMLRCVAPHLISRSRPSPIFRARFAALTRQRFPESPATSPCMREATLRFFLRTTAVTRGGPDAP